MRIQFGQLFVLLIAYLIHGGYSLIHAPRDMTFEDAVNYCKGQSRSLVKIDDAEKNNFVFEYAIDNKIYNYWITGNDIAEEGHWVDNENNTLTYTNWNAGEPNGRKNGNCVHGTPLKNGAWNDTLCNRNFTVICEKQNNIEGKEQYKLTHAPVPMAFDNAVNYCKGRSRNLVKIEYAEKNSFVYEYAVENKLGNYWINGNDKMDESIWVDTYNTKITYRNWMEGQPTGSRKENCINAMINNAGLWNDINCTADFSVICEKENDIEDIKYISTRNKVPYEEAVAYCLNKSMELVKIDNAVTNTFIFRYARSNGIPHFWINGNDNAEEGQWVDSSNNALPFENWHQNEPNGGRKENCIMGGYYNNEVWNDFACNHTYAVICQPVAPV